MKSTLRFAGLLFMGSLIIFIIGCNIKHPAEPDKKDNNMSVVYVKSNATSSIHDGKTWITAFLSVQEGIDAASSDSTLDTGKEVWVAAGTYVECIKLKNGVALYGGFAGNETSREQRDWTKNITILDGNQEGSVVTAVALMRPTRIDGFTIRNGNALDNTRFNGGGIYCNCSALMILNNTIIGNIAAYGGGICIENANATKATISNNVIMENSAEYWGGGIVCDGSSPTITNNTITKNNSLNGAGIFSTGVFGFSFPIISKNLINENDGDGIKCHRGGEGTISNNIITGNTENGILCFQSSPKIYTNVISGNGEQGIEIVDYSPSIYNNTICGNGDIGIGCYSDTFPNIINNIVAFNSKGIHSYNSKPILRNNCVFGNISYNYDGIVPGDGDISMDPKFVDSLSGDHHLLDLSPCIDRGDDSVVKQGWLDIDGQPRIKGAHVDIGADEFH